MTNRERLAKAAPAVVRDCAGIAGVGMIAIGAGQIYAPAGLIAGGLLLLAGAVLSARRG